MFYLSFENSICKDYITEKFWRMKNLIVPVVLNRAIYDVDVLKGTFIAASDFDSPSSLAMYLKNLSSDKEEYLKYGLGYFESRFRYFSWTKNYKKTPAPIIDFCEVCEHAWSDDKNIISNLTKWWEEDGVCIDDYSRNLLLSNGYESFVLNPLTVVILLNFIV